MDNIKLISKKSESKYLVKKNVGKFICEIVPLNPNDSNFKIDVHEEENGNILFNKVCEKMGGILEKDYFGLKYIDKHGQQQWLELNRSTYKQIKNKSQGKSTHILSFRFKYYPRDPDNDLKQDLSKYLLYLQLRRDLYQSRLVGSQDQQFRLAALILQAEIGSLDTVNLDFIKFEELKILPNIIRGEEIKIISIHDSLKDLDYNEAEILFLNEASKMETYGVWPVAVKDQKGNSIFIGATCEGVSTYSNNKRIHTFYWKSIVKLSFSHKIFMFQVIIDQKKHILGFKCDTSNGACALWKLALDMKCFFTLRRSCEARRSRSGGSLFKWKKSYTFSGRSQQELTKNCEVLSIIPQPRVTRAQSMKTLLRSQTASVNEKFISNEFNGFTTLPLSQGKNLFFGDSYGNDISSKSPFKERLVRTKPTSAAIGTVLDFMNALRVSPIPDIECIEDNNPQLKKENADYFEQSDIINDEDDFNSLAKTNEIIDYQCESSSLNSKFNIMENKVGQISTLDSTKYYFSFLNRNFSTFMIILILFLNSIIFLIIYRIMYKHNTESSSNNIDEISSIFSRGSIYNLLFKKTD